MTKATKTTRNRKTSTRKVGKKMIKRTTRKSLKG